MAAAVITEPKKMRIEEVPIPQPGFGQVRIRLEGCGVCGSNVPPWDGRPWFEYPMTPGALGHEGWGVVDALGSDVEDVVEGQRVTAITYNAYAPYDVADARGVVMIPDSLAGVPFPGEPLGCAMNIFRRCDVHPGQTVAIVGIGFLGALLTQLVSKAGATVVAISRRPFSREVARKAGAAETIELTDEAGPIVEKVKALTGGRLCERVIEAVGRQQPLELCGELAAERGMLIIAGYHQDGLRQINMQLWNWRGLDVINAHERDQNVYISGMREAVEAVEQGRIDPGGLLTHSLPLEQLGEALSMTRDRPDGFLKAIVTME